MNGFNNIRISSELTLLQCKYLSFILSELKSRNDAIVHCIFIKYIYKRLTNYLEKRPNKLIITKMWSSLYYIIRTLVGRGIKIKLDLLFIY